MKDNILYAYHLEIDEIKEYSDYSVFCIQDVTYYFTKLKRTEKEFQELLEVMNELHQKGLQIFPIIVNTSGSFVTMVDTIPYVLIAVTNPTVEYDLMKILEFQKLFVLNYNKSSLYRNEWAELWSSKVDYLEYQIHELGKEHSILINSFSYYVGLAENAISYARSTFKKIPNDAPIVLSHRRVFYPNIRLNFDNPLNFIFDIEVRDIAEYIKSMFFEDSQLAMIDLQSFVHIRKPSLYSLSMLYARLLYPSYYFDLHERIIENKENDDDLLPIIDKIDEYETFLKDAWLFLKDYAPLEPVPWIVKKES